MNTKTLLAILVFQSSISCQSEDFKSSNPVQQASADNEGDHDDDAKKDEDSTPDVNSSDNTATVKKKKKDIASGEVNGNTGIGERPKSCSAIYTVSGRSNPYLAGMPDQSSINYGRHGTDTSPADNPTIVTPTSLTCIQSGKALYFEVSGTISRGGGNPMVNADGEVQTAAQTHSKGAWFGKSDVRAPFVSLLGVFLTDQSPATNAAPAMLDFSTAASRDYHELRPEIGQVFYIGDGKDSKGDLQKVIVPVGATRFYFAVMDIFQWHNNPGSLSAGILAK